MVIWLVWFQSWLDFSHTTRQSLTTRPKKCKTLEDDLLSYWVSVTFQGDMFFTSGRYPYLPVFECMGIFRIHLIFDSRTDVDYVAFPKWGKLVGHFWKIILG